MGLGGVGTASAGTITVFRVFATGRQARTSATSAPPTVVSSSDSQPRPWAQSSNPAYSAPFTKKPWKRYTTRLEVPSRLNQSRRRGIHAITAMQSTVVNSSWTKRIDMPATGVDVLISAPQKGWSASPSAGMVMFSGRALERLAATRSDSFALDLARWRAIMQAYEEGGHDYHATLPTDALAGLRDAMAETREMGFEAAKAAQWELGRRVRAELAGRGFRSVAADGFAAPGVVVSYTDDPEIQSGRKFAQAGMQIASGVPLQIGEGPDFRTFRLGLFGLDKLADVDGTMARLTGVLDRLA